ncbi:hypothetical protein TcWFU_007454 [Taenia crassiceps]|uniref:EGF-like domain-containing protein n=1 Tax=Taenia crassiceps TaxID=6207 RepID=A0ABR4QB77_9CEST
MRVFLSFANETISIEGAPIRDVAMPCTWCLQIWPLFLLLPYFATCVMLLPSAVSSSSSNDVAVKQRFHLLSCIYSVRQCLPACLNGGRLWRPSMPWKKCHCDCPPGFHGFVCQFYTSSK